jgi:hypothetical protein
MLSSRSTARTPLRQPGAPAAVAAPARRRAARAVPAATARGSGAPPAASAPAGPSSGSAGAARAAATAAAAALLLLSPAAPPPALAGKNPVLDLPSCSEFAPAAGGVKWCDLKVGTGDTPLEGDLVMVDYTARALAAGGRALQGARFRARAGSAGPLLAAGGPNW